MAFPFAAVALGLGAAGAVMGAMGKHDQARAQKAALKDKSKIAGINAEAARQQAEYELQAWKSVADNNENLNKLQAEFNEMMLNKEALVSGQLAQYRTQFAREAINAESNLMGVVADMQRRSELEKLDRNAMMAGVKAGLTKGRTRASMAARGVAFDDGSVGEVMDSLDFARDVDYAEITGRASEIEQRASEQSAQRALQTSTRIGEINLNLRTRTIAEQTSLESKKQDLHFGRDLEDFMARQRLKNNALKRAWGYKTQAMNDKLEQRTNAKSASSIDPGLNAFGSLLSDASGLGLKAHSVWGG